ncbi:von Willebrand factor A domain-containing protein 5A-like isoform X2 [Lineus longissimus]|uniref:von Willebrand factor A domain-containing protein 5A-like isoform X2 n=1 Tax=Lineus longissimus TaxID=88925 RepID=UPI00315D11F2
MDSNDAFGLVYKKGQGRWRMQEIKVPLESASVDISVKGFVADVTSTLTYRHQESEAIESAFVFPMDEQSAVYHFQAEIDGRVIIGECQTKEEAQQTYDTAVETGHTAFLMNEEKTSDVFRIIIGNLPPKKVAEIKFSYVVELPIEVDDSLKFVLPTVLNPRYGVPESSTWAEKTVSYKFSLKASVFAAAENKITAIVSDTHQIQVDYKDEQTKAEVKFSEESKSYSDLTLNIFYKDMHIPQAIYEAGCTEASGFMKQDIVMLNFFPESPDGITNHGEYIFVVDRSGSMSGSKIASASATLLLFLKSLPVGCYFNVVSFGSRFEFLFKQGSATYNEANLKTALSLQKDMKADFRGTEMYEPLENIYRSPCKDGHPRQIFLLTDGDTGGTDKIIKLVKKNADNTRVFTFGIGEGASTALVKGVARAGRGTCEFVQKSDKLQSKVMSILKQARQDYTSDVKLNWKLQGENTAVSIPKEVPEIFSGQKLIMFGLLKEQLPDGGTGEVELSWKVEGKQLSHELEVVRGNSNEGTSLHRLAAKKKIQELQQCEPHDKTATKEAIVLLSTSANIVSNYTSFVAVDKDSKVNAKIVKQAREDIEDQSDCLGEDGLMAYSLCSSGPVLKGGGLAMESRGSRVGKKMSAFKRSVTKAFSGIRKPKAKGLSPNEPSPAISPQKIRPGRVYHSSASAGIRKPKAKGLSPNEPSPAISPQEFRPEPLRNDESYSVACCPSYSEDSFQSDVVGIPMRRAMSLSRNKPSPAISPSKSMPMPPQRRGCSFKAEGIRKPIAMGLSPNEPSPAISPRKVRPEPLRKMDCSFVADDSLTVKAGPPESRNVLAKDSPLYKKVDPDTLMGMVDQQTFDGHWELSEAVVNLLGKDAIDLKSSSPLNDLSVWATALVLAWLDMNWSESKDDWEMLYDKAYSWLKGQGEALEGKDPADLVQAARKALE